MNLDSSDGEHLLRSIDGRETWEPNLRLSNAPGDSQHSSLIVAGLVHLAWHDRGTPATVKSTTAAQPTGVPPGRRRRMCRGVTASLRRRCWLQRHTIGISSGFTIELADSRFSTNGAYFVAKPREKIDTSRGFLRRTVEAHEAMSLRLRRLRIVGSNGASPLIKRAR